MTPMTDCEIRDMLAETRIGRLCMADPADHRPYAIPLPFCWHAGSLYLRLRLVGRKGSVLDANPLVCFEVDSFTDSLDEYASVLVEGRLVEVTDLDEKAAVKQLNDAKYNRLRKGFRPGHGRSTPLTNLPLRKIVVERLTGLKKDSNLAAAAPLAAVGA